MDVFRAPYPSPRAPWCWRGLGHSLFPRHAATTRSSSHLTSFHRQDGPTACLQPETPLSHNGEDLFECWTVTQSTSLGVDQHTLSPLVGLRRLRSLRPKLDASIGCHLPDSSVWANCPCVMWKRAPELFQVRCHSALPMPQPAWALGWRGAQCICRALFLLSPMHQQTLCRNPSTM